MDFEQAAKNILAREGVRVDRLKKTELARWQENPEHETEIRILRKILWNRGDRGRALESVVKYFSDNPHPLSDYLAECPCPPGTVSRFLGEVRADYERLLAQAGEGGGV
jgi:hypothetical protein